MEPNPAYEASRQSKLNAQRQLRIAVIVVASIGLLAAIGPIAHRLGLVPNDVGHGAVWSAPSRKSCDDVGHLTACVEHAVLRTRISDGYEGVTATGNAVFILVRVVVANHGNATDRIGWSSFALRSRARTWEPDTHVTLKLLGSEQEPLGLIEEVHPGTSVAGWLAFFAPRDVANDAFLSFKPGLIRAVDLALPGLGGTPSTCSVDGQTGQCIDVSTCTGRHIAGFCDGPATVQCCLP